MAGKSRQRGSRYTASVLFQPPKGGRPEFRGLRPRHIGPATGVLEHVIKTGDRLDLLALQYYNDTRLWWRIIDANADVLYAGQLNVDEKLGEVLLIPRITESGGAA